MNKKFIKPIVLVLLIGMFVYFAYGLIHQSKKTDVGNEAYNFSLKTADGKIIKPSDYKGQMVILNYFASWCAPCQQEAPDLAQFVKDYGNKYHLIMIDRGETPADVQPFLKKYKITATVVYDYDGTVGKIFNTTGQPETFVIDKNGIIREHYNGPLTESQLYDLVKKHDI